MKFLTAIFLLALAGYSQVIDIDQFYHSDEASVTKITLSQDLGPVSLWGFTEHYGDEEEYENFNEYRLTLPMYRDYRLQLEYNDILGADNDILRLGVTYKIPLWDGWLNFRVFPYETGNEAYQASMIFGYPFTDRLSVIGFFDLDIYQDQELVVFEPTFIYQLSEQWSAQARYTYNDYLNRVIRDRNAVTIGVGYRYEASSFRSLLRNSLFPVR